MSSVSQPLGLDAMNTNASLFPQDDDIEPMPAPAASPETPAANARPRLRKPERHQVEMRWESLDHLLPPDHQARIVWQWVERLDLTALLQTIRAVDGRPGRSANDPRLLLALWLYATIDGVGAGRELERLCEEHLAYRWLCGGVTMNQHTLTDFRNDNVAVLNDLLIESVATLRYEGLVELNRVAQDGMRVRASAGASSFRRIGTLKEHLEEARAQVQELQKQLGEDENAVTRRQRAARERGARERIERLEQALQEHAQLTELRETQKREKGTKVDVEQLRTSETDPEARRMKMPDGGTRPAYNVPLATTVGSGIIVAVDVTNSGGDGGQMAPMIDKIAEDYGQAPAEMLVDGGFTTLDDIEQVHATHQTKVFGPIKEEEKKKANGVDPFQPRPRDGEGVAAWRTRMGTEDAKNIYKLRAQTAEWANAGMRNRGLQQFRVRGLRNVLAVALCYALAHNLLRGYALQAKASAERAAKPATARRAAACGPRRPTPPGCLLCGSPIFRLDDVIVFVQSALS
jgi:transposase